MANTKAGAKKRSAKGKGKGKVTVSEVVDMETDNAPAEAEEIAGDVPAAAAEEEKVQEEDSLDEESGEDEFTSEDLIFLKKDAERDEDGRGIIYVGRIPHGFYEKEMRAFFSQFGPVTRLRISRNKKTGKSKHFGFVEFEDYEVAKIAAETMDGYLMLNHILRVKLLDNDKVHPRLFVGANKPFKPARTVKSHKAGHNMKKEVHQYREMKKRLLRSDEKKKRKLEELGIEYSFPGYSASVDAVQPKQKKARVESKAEKAAEAVPQKKAAAAQKKAPVGARKGDQKEKEAVVAPAKKATKQTAAAKKEGAAVPQKEVAKKPAAAKKGATAAAKKETATAAKKEPAAAKKEGAAAPQKDAAKKPAAAKKEATAAAKKETATAPPKKTPAGAKKDDKQPATPKNKSVVPKAKASVEAKATPATSKKTPAKDAPAATPQKKAAVKVAAKKGGKASK